MIQDTDYGRICLGTPGDDNYEGDFAILIDPGGNDHYVNCRIGAAYGTENRRVGFFADLGGDDFYDCAETNITLGAAVLGVAAFYDLGQGDDRYLAGSCTLGAAMGGVATFYDDGGSDVYEGKVYTQGAAGFGIGVFMDDSLQDKPVTSSDEGTPDPVDIGLFDNDRLSAWANAQAFARPKGVALCINRRGNDVYEAGGVYLHAPLFSDRYQSFSQGFSIGERGIDYAGGIAMIIDYDGNDRYLGDIYNQGVGYWYGAGLLWDGGGNDLYEMTQYGQGSGIHLAIGGLVDAGGNDTYVMHSGLGQGGSHDYAASVLHDRGGNDHYMGMTSCNGSGLTNSVGLHFDRSGDDTYAGRSKSGVNFGRPARGFGSIGVLVDLAGTDDYLGIMEDGSTWKHTTTGVGIDVVPPAQEEASSGNTPDAGAVSGEAPIPEICSYEGEITQEVFDELWEIACRWEVGDNRYIVPEARRRLFEFGLDVLPFISERMDSDNSGLALRAFVDIFKKFIESGDEGLAGVEGVLRENAAAENETRIKVALYLIGELKLASLGDTVTAFLDHEDESMVRRAIGILGQLKSDAANDRLIAMLSPGAEEKQLRLAMTTLMGLEADCWNDLSPLLGHPLDSIRGALANQVIAHWEKYGPLFLEDFNRVAAMKPPAYVRRLRAMLLIVERMPDAPDEALVATITGLLSHEDWGVRADAARIVRKWEDKEGVDQELIAPAVQALGKLLETETEPFVLFGVQ